MSTANLRPWQLPIHWPAEQPDRAAEASARARRLLQAAIVFALVALTLLDRFGLRLNAEFSIPPGMVALYVLCAVLLLGGTAALNVQGAVAYAGVVAVAGLSLAVNATFDPRSAFSVTSFLLVLVLYAPFALGIAQAAASPALWRWTVRAFVASSVLLAIAGTLQFFVQFVLRDPWLFNYAPLIPESFRASGGWNTAYAMTGWIKSNGFFLREPSIFSIAMAFGLLCELSLDRRRWVIAVLAIGLLLSYSGSGLMCLAFALLFPLGWRSLRQVLACAALGAALFFVLGDVLNLNYTVSRVDEFASDRSSAYCRFIYPGQATLQQAGSNPWAALLGHGPGTMVRMGATCADGTQTTYAKLLFEYGLAGAAAFGVLIVGALRRSGAPARIQAGLGLAWVLLGGNLVASEFLLLIFLLSAMWPAGIAGAAEARR